MSMVSTQFVVALLAQACAWLALHWDHRPRDPQSFPTHSFKQNHLHSSMQPVLHDRREHKGLSPDAPPWRSQHTEAVLEHPWTSFHGHEGTRWVCGKCFLRDGLELNAYSSSNCQGCGRVAKRKQQQQVQASSSSTSSNSSKGTVFSTISGQQRQAQAETPEGASMLAAGKPRIQEVPWQVLAGKGGKGTRSAGSRETQLNQAPVEAATSFVDKGSPARVHEPMAQALSAHRPRALADLVSGAGPEQTRRATTELQPIGRLREAWLATESALGPDHTITKAVKQKYDQLVQCRKESMPLQQQLQQARKQWEEAKQTLSNFQRWNASLTKQIQDLHTRKAEFTIGEMNAEEAVACEKAELEALVELCLGIQEQKGRSQQGSCSDAETPRAIGDGRGEHSLESHDIGQANASDPHIAEVAKAPRRSSVHWDVRQIDSPRVMKNPSVFG